MRVIHTGKSWTLPHERLEISCAEEQAQHNRVFHRGTNPQAQKAPPSLRFRINYSTNAAVFINDGQRIRSNSVLCSANPSNQINRPKTLIKIVGRALTLRGEQVPLPYISCLKLVWAE